MSVFMDLLVYIIFGHDWVFPLPIIVMESTSSAPQTDDQIHIPNRWCSLHRPHTGRFRSCISTPVRVRRVGSSGAVDGAPLGRVGVLVRERVVVCILRSGGRLVRSFSTSKKRFAIRILGRLAWKLTTL